MNRMLRNLVESAVGVWLLRPYRLGFAVKQLCRPMREVPRWVVRSRERTNYTYRYSALGFAAANEFVSIVTAVDISHVEAFAEELERDTEFEHWLVGRIAASPYRYSSDTHIAYGRRLLYYLIVRAQKPRSVVEAGTDKGLGACLIARALQRNAQEGYPGHLHALDLRPDRGYLLGECFADVAELRFGDSVTFLEQLEEPIDFFIHDTSPAVEHEVRQYAAVERKLSPTSLTLSIWYTAAFVDFARRNHRRFLVFAESPADHWYPGGRLPVSLPPA